MHAANILIACCDDLMKHIGELKHKDKATPATAWVPMLNRILDARCQIMAARDQAKKPTPTPTPTNTQK